MRRIVPSLLVIAVLAIGPTVALDDREGVYVGLQASGVQAGNDDVVLALPLDLVNIGMAGPAATLDQGTGLAAGFEVGYKGFDWDIGVSVWGYDETETVTAFDLDPLDGIPDLLVVFGHPLYGDLVAERVDGESTLEVGTLDVAWSRMIYDTDRSVWHWTLGFRAWSLDREVVQTSDLDPVSGVFDDRVVLRSESTAVGFFAGLRARYEFTRRVWGTTSLRFGFLTGQTDVGYDEDAFGDLLFTSVDGADRNFLHTDLDTRINFNVAGGFDLFLGYQYRNFGDAVSRLAFPDDLQEGASSVTKSDISFSGATVGASLVF